MISRYDQFKPGNFTLIFPTRIQRRICAYTGRWPFGSVPDLKTFGWKVPKIHPKHDKICDEHANEAAQAALMRERLNDERIFDRILGLPFIEPEDRIYLYLTSREEAQKEGIRYDKDKCEWYVPKDHPDIEFLLENFTSPASREKWELRIRRKEEVERAYRDQIRIRIAHARADRRKGGKTISISRGSLHHKKPTGRLPIKSLALMALEEMLLLSAIDPFEQQQDITDYLTIELQRAGIDVALTTVRDALFHKNYREHTEKLIFDARLERELRKKQ